ncbi:UNVERIFIED_CONTAM: hypothetical protein ABIC26_001237 [Paenibacillus sp. PvR008]
MIKSFPAGVALHITIRPIIKTDNVDHKRSFPNGKLLFSYEVRQVLQRKMEISFMVCIRLLNKGGFP